jgi:hypothetical protein
MSSGAASDHRTARRRAALLALGLLVGIGAAAGVAQRLARDNEGVVALLAPRGRP